MKFETFKKEYYKTLDQFSDNVLSAPWENKDFYCHWLAQTYYFVCKSTRLIALSASLFNEKESKLHSRSLEHIREERGHENLATNDLKALDRNITQQPEFTQTAGFYQSQYFWIIANAPVSFIGYVLCLEGLAVQAGPKIYQRVKDTYGEKAGMFLKVHVEEDGEHVELALNELKEVSEEKLDLVMKNLIHSCDTYTSMVREAEARARAGGKAKKAA